MATPEESFDREKVVRLMKLKFRRDAAEKGIDVCEEELVQRDIFSLEYATALGLSLVGYTREIAISDVGMVRERTGDVSPDLPASRRVTATRDIVLGIKNCNYEPLRRFLGVQRDYHELLGHDLLVAKYTAMANALPKPPPGKP